MKVTLYDCIILFAYCMWNFWLRHYISWCLDTCRHFENNSDRLFKKVFFIAFINKSFSSWHKLHRFDPALYAATCFIIDHLMWWSRFPIFILQMCFDNSVSLAYFSYRNEKYEWIWINFHICLSKHIWKLKIGNLDHHIKSSIIKHVAAYKAGSKRCNLCLEEKLLLMKAKKKNFWTNDLNYFRSVDT